MEENRVLETIKKRRSVRQYKPDQVAEDELQAVLEAGRCAPSGGNNQTSHILVIQNKEVLEELKELARLEFAKMEIQEGMYKSLRSTILKSRREGYDFTYGAPTLIVLANRKGYGNAMADCTVALENMMIAAVSLGLGSCYINQPHWLDENLSVRAFFLHLGMKEDETICCALALGYPRQKGGMPELLRTGNPVTYIK
ncbi:nitroreductase [Anaerolentibacter hominis]|uniref:nitroreductase family protein n=1 Tax=Anaerolentibacter hominis TaxID=3079009 RepID=UPI0031B88115